jgi:hypothetical protein
MRLPRRRFQEKRRNSGVPIGEVKE